VSNVYYLWALIAMPCLLALYVVIITNWRLGIYGLIIFIPFCGLPTILLYPAPVWTHLLKDVFFVLPAYLGFLRWYVFGQRGAFRLLIPRVPICALAVLTVITSLGLLNPALANIMVGLIGLRTWLFYIPMVFLGYYLVRSKAELVAVSRLMILVATVPAIFGIVQALLYYSGKRELAYAIYGAAAFDVTQGFTSFSAVGGENGLTRLPSLFTFGLQYSFFLFTMLPIAAALALAEQSRSARIVARAVLAVILMAGFVSGSRAAFVIMPALLVFTAVLVRGAKGAARRIIGAVVLTGFGLFLVTTLLDSKIRNLALHVLDAANQELLIALPYEFRTAAQAPWLGMGTGMTTGPARVAFTSLSSMEDSGVGGIENYYAKARLELGVPGMIVVIILMIQIVMSGYWVRRSVSDRDLKYFAATLTAFFAIVVAYLVKGSPIDYDPLNVYFWLFFGILLKLPRLQANLGGSGTMARATMYLPEAGHIGNKKSHDNRLQ
jgi:hypothetical protein